ncbi:hypothetical protein SAMN05444287_0904 [Octadecabacter temperatus]|uniref:Uncharacterized protein n=1 Tax=Octadecabacter temperatus TaxID=1458307 RepID=A0A0K0Y4E5_9RHOB|nr:hypothetical protein [Octadecabacter temperatus]AKS45805.1 hypothetical protein OSB_12500 [Octadecabacter temperatus]SIO00926.1 hypothetical protein SAMN05444287_0904 [Octadecabacter temperatus]
MDEFEDGGAMSDSSVIYRKNSDGRDGFGKKGKTASEIAREREKRARIERGLEARERMTPEQREAEEARLKIEIDEFLEGMKNAE